MVIRYSWQNSDVRRQMFEFGDQGRTEVRPARNAFATPGIARLSRGGRACEAGGGQMSVIRGQ